MTPRIHQVHNWYIELDIGDTAIATGTKSEDGGFSITIVQRHQGKYVPAAVVSGHVELDSGRLWLTIRTQDPSHPLLQFKTER